MNLDQLPFLYWIKIKESQKSFSLLLSLFVSQSKVYSETHLTQKFFK